MHQFRSRVSVLLLLFILAAVAPIFLFDDGKDDMAELITAYSILFGSIGIVLVMLFTLRYEIGESYLIIKMGPINMSRIKLSDIQKVERTYNPLSSPASSLKRLYIKAGKKDAIISPVDETEFVRLLKARNPNIEVHISDKEGWWRFWDWDL
jgi:hypothetical protein